jgi:hypothetical protein
MPRPSRWNRLTENATELSAEAVHLTPLSRRVFRITDVRDDWILAEY